MPLPASGAIGLAECGNHIHIATGSPVSMDGNAFRAMAGVVGTISMSSLYGLGIQASASTYAPGTALNWSASGSVDNGNVRWFNNGFISAASYEVYCELLAGSLHAESSTVNTWITANQVLLWFTDGGTAQLRLYVRNAHVTQQILGIWNLSA